MPVPVYWVLDILTATAAKTSGFPRYIPERHVIGFAAAQQRQRSDMHDAARHCQFLSTNLLRCLQRLDSIEFGIGGKQHGAFAPARNLLNRCGMLVGRRRM